VAAIYPPEPGAVCNDCDTDQTDGVGLEGQPHGGDLGCWCVCGFKPIYRPKSELFEHHLTKASTPELVDA
jgi:hypothetical protein